MSKCRLMWLVGVALCSAPVWTIPTTAHAGSASSAWGPNFRLVSEFCALELAAVTSAPTLTPPGRDPARSSPSPSTSTSNPQLTAKQRSELEDRLASNESWRTVGKVLTWTGIIAGGIGLLMMGSGAAASAAGAFSLDFGRFAGGAILLNMGAVVAGSALLTLAVGIPLWAINAGRASRLRRRLDRGRPVVTFDPRTGATLVGWATAF